MDDSTDPEEVLPLYPGEPNFEKTVTLPMIEEDHEEDNNGEEEKAEALDPLQLAVSSDSNEDDILHIYFHESK